MVVSTARLAGGYDFPALNDVALALEASAMGQQLLDPPSVEGWHTGKEWINTASLMTRVNFAAQQFADATRPGVKTIIDAVQVQEPNVSPERLVDTCLDLLGPLTISPRNRQELLDYAAADGDVHVGEGHTVARVTSLLQLIVALPEYQFA
jgi:hypothetical protein